MLQDGKLHGPTAATDLARLSAQFDELRGDVVHAVQRRGQTADVGIEAIIAVHSFLALFLSVDVGLMIGALSQS